MKKTFFLLFCVALLASPSLNAAEKFIEYHGVRYEVGGVKKANWKDALTYCESRGMTLPQSIMHYAITDNSELQKPEGAYWLRTDYSPNETKANSLEYRGENFTFNPRNKNEKLYVRCSKQEGRKSNYCRVCSTRNFDSLDIGMDEKDIKDRLCLQPYKITRLRQTIVYRYKDFRGDVIVLKVDRKKKTLRSKKRIPLSCTLCNRETYDKLKKGMQMTEVPKILCLEPYSIEGVGRFTKKRYRDVNNNIIVLEIDNADKTIVSIGTSL